MWKGGVLMHTPGPWQDGEPLSKADWAELRMLIARLIGWPIFLIGAVSFAVWVGV